MILEIAQITVKAGMENRFEAGVAEAKPLFQRAKGCLSMELVRSVGATKSAQYPANPSSSATPSVSAPCTPGCVTARGRSLNVAE